MALTRDAPLQFAAMERPRYKTWVRTKPLVIFAILTAVSLALAGLAFVSLFFLAFLPQFIDPALGNTVGQTLILGAM